MNLILSPVNVTINYKKAIINAVTEVWPENNIICCRFHLTNSWWKKIQSLSLSNEYKKKIGKWVSLCCTESRGCRVGSKL